MGGLRRGSSNAAPPSDMPASIAKTTGHRGGKGPLLKQRRVEEGAGRSEKNSIAIPTIIVKAPSTSSSGRSSQNSSVETEPSPQLEDEEADHHSTISIPVPPIALPPVPPTPFPPDVGGTAQRERERFRDSRRKSTSFFYSSEEDVLDELNSAQPAQNVQSAPRLRPSKSIDEGLFSSDAASMPPAFGLPQYASQHNTTFIHPLTGKVLDPSSPLSLALAARERALKDDRRSRKDDRHFERQFSTAAAFPMPLTHNPQHQSSSSMHQAQAGTYLSGSSPTSTSHSPLSRPQSPRMLRLSGSGVMSVEREGRDVQKVQLTTERTNQYQTYRRDREGHGKMSQQPPQHRPPLLRMDTKVSANVTHHTHSALETTKKSDTEREKDENKEEDPDSESGGGVMVLPPPAPSVDIADEFVFAEPLPPPLQFANGVDRSVQGATMYNQHQQEHPQQELHGGQSLPHCDQQLQNTPLEPPGPTETSQSLTEIHLSTFHPSAIVHPFLFPPSPLLPPPQLCPKILPANPAQPTQMPQIHPQPPLASPQAADSAASSLTSYDSEVANLTQSSLSPSLPSPQVFPLTSTPSASNPTSDPSLLHRPLPVFYPPQDRGSATLTYATMTTAAAATATATVVTVTMTTPSASRPVVGGERIQSESKGVDWPEAVVDSGIKEPGSHSSSNYHTERVSGERRQQDSRVNAESGGIKEGRRVSLDSFLSNTNHQFKMHNDTHAKTHMHKSKPPPPMHAKPHLHNTSKLHTNAEIGRTVPSLRRQTSAAPGYYQTDEKMEGRGVVKAPSFMDRHLNSPLSSVKASIISELSNKLQQPGGWQGQGSQLMQRSEIFHYRQF